MRLLSLMESKTNKMKTVQEKHVGFEVAKLAKEKGFEQKTKEYYSNKTKVTSVSYGDYPCPTQAMLRDWIEANSEMVLSVVPFLHRKEWFFRYEILFIDPSKNTSSIRSWNTRHLALEDLLLNALNRMP